MNKDNWYRDKIALYSKMCMIFIRKIVNKYDSKGV